VDCLPMVRPDAASHLGIRHGRVHLSGGCGSLVVSIEGRVTHVLIRNKGISLEMCENGK